jgi:hypothetical protein
VGSPAAVLGASVDLHIVMLALTGSARIIVIIVKYRIVVIILIITGVRMGSVLQPPLHSVHCRVPGQKERAIFIGTIVVTIVLNTMPIDNAGMQNTTGYGRARNTSHRRSVTGAVVGAIERAAATPIVVAVIATAVDVATSGGVAVGDTTQTLENGPW